MSGKYIKRKLKKFFRSVGKKIQSIGKIPWYIRRSYVRRRIKSRDFTIISNNCWAGSVYRYLGMPYLSPTVGLYFFADDYIRFLSDLRRYLSLELEFITADESKHKDELYRRGQQDRPIGRLGDVEIVFLHYGSREEAGEKWNRRKKRVNYGHIYYKMSQQNGCNESHMKSFSDLPCSNLILLTSRKKPRYDCEFYWNGKTRNGEIAGDTEPFPGNISLVKIFAE